jgi:hypothetical protein
VSDGTEMRKFGKAICYNHDDGFVARFGLSNNEIHRNIHPDNRWNRQRLECARNFDCFTFIALKSITFIHKGMDVMFHAFPTKRMFDSCIDFVKTQIPGYW